MIGVLSLVEWFLSQLDALLDATSNHSNNVGSNNDDISDPEEIATEYSVDLNHNAGKIVMKIVKKWKFI